MLKAGWGKIKDGPATQFLWKTIWTAAEARCQHDVSQRFLLDDQGLLAFVFDN